VSTMSLVKRLFRGSIAQTLHIVVTIGVGLFMLPFMVSQLGESMYGIWILIGGFTATLYLFDFGFATAVTRFMARYIQQEDTRKANQVINSSLIIYSGLAVVVMLASAVIAWVSPVWVENPDNVLLIRLLILIAGLQIALGFPFKAFAGIAAAYVRYDLTAWCRIVVKVLSTVCSVIALLHGYELLAISLVQLGASILTDIILISIAKYLHPAMRIRREFVDGETMRSLFNYSNWAFLIDITNLAKDKADIFLIGAYLGTSLLTTYYVAVRLVEYSLQFLTKATGMSTPVFAASQAKGDTVDLHDKIAVFLRINMILGGFALFGLILLGEPLIRLWMGAEFEYTTAYHTLVVLVSGRMLMFLTAPMGSVLMATSRHRLQAFLGIAETLTSASLIFLLIGVLDYGIVAAAIGVSAPLFIGRAFVMPFIVQREVGFTVNRAIKELGKPIVLIALSCIVASAMTRFLLPTGTLPEFLFTGLAITTVYWLFVLPSLSKREWGHLAQLLPGKLGVRARNYLSANQ